MPPRTTPGPIGRPTAARSRTPSAPTDPVALLATPIGASGLSGAAAIRRVGPRLGIATVRDLLFHLPRRYDDRRRMETIAELMDREPTGSRSAPGSTVSSIRVEQGVPAADPADRRRRPRRDRRRPRRSGSAGASSRSGSRAGDRLVVSGRLKKRGLRGGLRRPRVPARGRRGRPPPRRPDRPDLPADGRDRAPRGCGSRCARRSTGPGWPIPSTCPPTCSAREEALVGIGRAIEGAHYPDDPEAQDAALRRLAFDELLALQLGMVGRRRQRVRSRARPLESSTTTATPRSGRP